MPLTDRVVIETATYRPLQTTRDHYLRELVSAVVGNAGLSHEAEQDLRRALTARLDPVLALADSAVAARVELEAVDRRLDRHVQTHDLCRIGAVQACWVLADLQRTRERLQRRADREMRALMGGRR